MRKITEFILALAALLLLLFAGNKVSDYVVSGQVKSAQKMVVLDAGHGGRDPGKIGSGDVLEKDLNLQVTERVQKCLEERGIHVVLTREKDEMLCEEDADNKKVQDLKNRVDFINREVPDLAVSIHQNSYEEASVRGAQVFYFTHSLEGKAAAETVQKELLKFDGENTRTEKANDTYYMLRRTQVPTIIVECGFLSNPEEAKQLSDGEYQQDLAEAIAAGVESWLVNGSK